MRYQLLLRVLFIAVALSPLWLFQASRAGVKFLDPTGGWRYTYDGAFNPGTDGLPDGFGNSQQEQALDGTWFHDQGDKWDSSAPGEVGAAPNGHAPGGAGRFIDTDQRDYIRIQDAGNPESHGWVQGGGIVNNNRRVYFGHDMTQDGSLGEELVLTNTGVTISFRSRIPNSGPLDDAYTELDLDLDTNLDVIPWFEDSPNGRGMPMTNGRGTINVSQNSPTNEDTQVGFSLVTSTDVTGFCSLTSGSLCTGSGSGGLIMNSLNGNAPSNLIDSESPGSLNMLEITDNDLNQWNEFWITMENNGAVAGNIEVNVYRNGSTAPDTFQVTLAANNNSVYADEDNPFVEFGISDNAWFGSFDMDFLSYQLGVHLPVAAPPENADFDNDGDIDGKDFLIWQTGFGGAGVARSDGNANGDLAIDGLDLAVWKSQFGGVAPLSAALNTVPEPGGLALALLLTLSAAFATRRSW